MFIVPDNIVSLFYDTNVPGVTYVTLANGSNSTQYPVAADATIVVAKIGADSMIEVSEFGQPSNIHDWLSLKRIANVFLAVDDPIESPGPTGATRIRGEHIKIDVSDTVATITSALGNATVITYP